jgi:hypothetical protein
MSSAPTAKEIARDATWLAQALDPSGGHVRLVAMDRDSYRAASFLDDRLMQSSVNAQIIPWPEVESAMASAERTDARWIFHIGHVGSTLISRLLGDLPNVLSVREPRILRDLALSPADVRGRYLSSVAKLISRTFADDEIACVKATSWASEIASGLVPPGERALFMYATPRNYVASILAGENSVKELHALAPMRAARMRQRGLELPPATNDAGLAALGWACEMTTLEAAADAMADRRVEWADFDAMLVDTPAELARVASFFGFEASPETIVEVVSGPLMSRYSKAMEYDYSANLRRDLIAEATTANRQAIEDALAMLARAAEKSQMLARALERAGEA